MEKFVKEISTNLYKEISRSDYDANPGLYIDRTDRPKYILEHYLDAGVSYWRARRHCVILADNSANGINDFNDQDKTALGVFAYGQQINEMKLFFESFYGISDIESSEMYLKNAALNRSNMAEDARKIVSSPKLMEIGIKYLTVEIAGELDSSQAFDLTEAIGGYLGDYERFAVLGIDHGDEHEGIMDYFRSTNGHSGGGLLMYSLNPALIDLYGSEESVRNAMIAELDDLYVEGNI